MAKGLAEGFAIAAAARRSALTAAAVAPPVAPATQASVSAGAAEFAKTLRKPSSLYEQLSKAVVSDLRKIPKLGDERNDKLGKLLTKGERQAYLESLIVNVGFGQPIAAAFDKSCFGLPLMGAALYSHMFAGLGNYISKKSGMPVEKAMRVHTYYRTPIVVEEMQRMGFSLTDIDDIVAKQFFLQYWSGDPFTSPDKHVFNPMVRAFYPPLSQMGSGGTDLGRETEMAAAMSFCEGLEGLPQPLRIISTGDTGPFTDGAMHALQHMIEAEERGIKIPLLFLVNSNNSAISARIDYGQHQGDDGDFGVHRIQDRFSRWGSLVEPGFTSWAEDPAEGIEAIRKAVDQIFETGKPSWCICRFPFRPGGHASDGSPASDDLLLSQFERFKSALVGQLAVAAPPGTPGSELADQLESRFSAINGAVQHALTGNKILTRHDIEELSAPGQTTTFAKNPGKMIELSADYLLGKRQKAFAGMGNDIYAKAINETMDVAREKNRRVRYVHQENHHRNQTDTRGGVYGELDKISNENLENFVGLMPQEAQACQIGMAMRSVLPKSDSGESGLVFVKGPHTVFNEHAKDHIKYAAYRFLDSGHHSNHIYVFDGGSLALQDKGQVPDPQTGEMKDRDMWLARVGEHHNTPDLSSFAHDANTIMALPLDMNMFARQVPAMIELHDLGRMVVCMVPTAAFGGLHPQLPFDEPKIDQNDCLLVKFGGKNKPLNGRRLLVVGYGPDVKVVAKELVEQDLEAEMAILSFNRKSNALTRYLDEIAVAGHECEVIVVDPNPGATMMAPIVFKTRETLGYPETLVFTFCTIHKSFVPYGNGNVLLNQMDMRASLMGRGVIPGGKEVELMPDVRIPMESHGLEVRKTTPVYTDVEERVLFAGSGSESAPMQEAVFAPMDGDGVVVSYMVATGDVVEVDQLLAEIESDKATIEVNAPSEGIVAELNLEPGVELNVTTETKILTLMSRDQPVKTEVPRDPNVKRSTIEKVMGTAYTDAADVQIKYLKKSGDRVVEGDVVAEKTMPDGSKIDVTAPTYGTLSSFYIDEDETVDVVAEKTKLFSVATKKAIRPGGKAPTAVEVDAEPDQTITSQTVALSRHQFAMIQNMSVQNGDTIPFVLQEVVDFNRITSIAKMAEVSPVAVLIRCLGEAAQETGFNRKLNRARDSMTMFMTVDIGVAIEVEGQLRVAVVRDVLGKSLGQIMENVKTFASKGAKLSMSDQDLSTCCWIVSSMGKSATSAVIPVLPKGCTGIVGVGRTNKRGESTLSLTICHATLTGMQGSQLTKAYVDKLGPA